MGRRSARARFGCLRLPLSARCSKKPPRNWAFRSKHWRKRLPARRLKLNPIRIGLYDSYGGSMPSGWTRWLFEQYEDARFQLVLSFGA